MAEPHIVSTLRAKRDELDRIISSYEGALAAARRDFVNVNATLELFEKNSAPAAYPSRISKVTLHSGVRVQVTAWAATIKRVVARFARGNIAAQSARILLPDEQKKQHGVAKKILLKWASRARRG